jgi:acyl-CoA synthetase (AMP-forming)/AMP-acid ligase II
VLRLNAHRNGGRIAFETSSGHSVTFRQFNERVNRLTNSIHALGLKRGARVAILSRNRVEYVEFYGITKAGYIAVPLNWRLTPEEITGLIRDSGPELLIADEHHRDMVEGNRHAWPSVTHFVLLGSGTDFWLPYEGLLSDSSTSEPAFTALPDDVLCLIYTSGTTGAPKGVAISHRGALGNCRVAASEMLALGEADRTMAVMPLFHVGGMWYHLFPSFASGCTTVILPEFNPSNVLRELSQREITNIHLVPTMIASLLADPAAATTKLPCLRLIFYAASSMPVDLLMRAMQRWPRSRFAQSYGTTEVGVVTVLHPSDHLRAREPSYRHLLSSCGRPMTGRSVRIVDDAGAVCSTGGVGEIEVASGDMMLGYWPKNRAGLARSSFKTGDVGYLDREGYLYIIDRKSDLIVTGGENVFPSEVEHHLCRDPAVLEAAVFGIADSHWIERVVAAVVLRSGTRADGQEIISRLRPHLAPYKCPKAIYVVDALPRSAAGKVLRKELRKQFAHAS